MFTLRSWSRGAALPLAALMLLGAGRAPAAEVTYVVGSCETGTSFTKIQAALNAIPAPTHVDVCPGSYTKQLVITKPVTLEGVAGTATPGLALLLPPSGGLIVNASDDFGSGVAAQVLVLGANVTLKNLVVDGTGNHITGSDLVAGIYFQDASGTVDHVTTRFQSSKLNGIGILLQGGASSPSVTVENSSVHDFDRRGILTETTGMGNGALTASLTGNVVVNPKPPGTPILVTDLSSGFEFDAGSTVTATDNYLDGRGIYYGLKLAGANGAISDNTIVNGGIGVVVTADGAVALDSNRLVGGNIAIGIGAALATTQIQSNAIEDVSTGIDFDCHSNDGLINSNTFIDVGTALGDAPTGTSAAGNSYYDVSHEIVNGSC